jgi:hypothetical protein
LAISLGSAVDSLGQLNGIATQRPRPICDDSYNRSFFDD